MTIIKETLQDEWLDAYGHLNEGYYLVSFSKACFSFFTSMDQGADYTARTGNAWYTAESHLRFLREVRALAMLEIQCTVLDLDTKRMRFGSVMIVDDIERATLESVFIHFDTKAGRAAAMPEDVQVRWQAMPRGALPSWAGRGISFEKR